MPPQTLNGDIISSGYGRKGTTAVANGPTKAELDEDEASRAGGRAIGKGASVIRHVGLDM